MVTSTQASRGDLRGLAFAAPGMHATNSTAKRLVLNMAKPCRGLYLKFESTDGGRHCGELVGC